MHRINGFSKSFHATSQAAWEYINQYIPTHEPEILEHHGTRYGPSVIMYDHVMEINRLWIDENLDFGKLFGYTPMKWRNLYKNYVNFNYLDVLKAEIIKRERKYSNHYNLSFHFSNSHGHGKGCLLTLTFSRRHNRDNIMVTLHLRASEVTKRLIFDFLLVQRICEYIFGDANQCSLQVYSNQFYIDEESFLMYSIHNDFKNFLYEPDYDEPKYKSVNRIKEIYEKFNNKPWEEFTYKVHLRSARQLQRNSGKEEKKSKPVLVKDCNF